MSSTTGAYRLNNKSILSSQVSGERKSFVQAMICLINFKNINFGLQLGELTNGCAAVLKQQLKLHFKGLGKKGFCEGVCVAGFVAAQ